MNEHEEPVLQDPQEPVVTHEGEQQQPHVEQASSNEAPKRSQRVRRSAIPDDYEVYECEEFQIKGVSPAGVKKITLSCHKHTQAYIFRKRNIFPCNVE